MSPGSFLPVAGYTIRMRALYTKFLWGYMTKCCRRHAIIQFFLIVNVVVVVRSLPWDFGRLSVKLFPP